MSKFAKLSNKITKLSKRKKFFFVLKIISFCVLINFLIFYLVQVSESSASAYKLSDLENRISDLRDSNELFKKEITRLQSMSNIQKCLDDWDMVAVEEIKYIEVGKAMARVESRQD